MSGDEVAACWGLTVKVNNLNFICPKSYFSIPQWTVYLDLVKDCGLVEAPAPRRRALTGRTRIGRNDSDAPQDRDARGPAYVQVRARLTAELPPRLMRGLSAADTGSKQGASTQQHVDSGLDARHGRHLGATRRRMATTPLPSAFPFRLRSGALRSAEFVRHSWSPSGGE